jgi:DNA-binding NarL/FixJ family response regulator
VTISVAVADDQALVRVGFCGIIAATEGLTVVGQAANGAEAVAVARAAHPDVVLMDVRMPVLDGIEATRQITSAPESAGARVIILTTFDLDEYVFGALRAGASGFLLKDTLPADLITAIRVVAAGEALLAPSVTRRMIAEFASRRPLPGQADRPPAQAQAAALAQLTARERETLVLLAQGKSNAEIAAAFVVSEHTVKTHVSNVLAKLQLRDRIHAVVYAYESGLVTPGQ